MHLVEQAGDLQEVVFGLDVRQEDSRKVAGLAIAKTNLGTGVKPVNGGVWLRFVETPDLPC